MNSSHEDLKAATTYWEYDQELKRQWDLVSLKVPPMGYYYTEDPWTEEIREIYRKSRERTACLEEASVGWSLVKLVMVFIVPAVIFSLAVREIAAIDGDLPFRFPWFTILYPVKIIGCGILAVWPDRWGGDVLTWTYIRIWGATRIHLEPGRMALNGCRALFLAAILGFIGAGIRVGL